MTLFISRDELVRLTGKRTRPAQVRELKRRKIPHEVNGAGEVLVATAYVEKRLGVEVEKNASPSAFPQEPDFTIFTH